MRGFDKEARGRHEPAVDELTLAKVQEILSEHDFGSSGDTIAAKRISNYACKARRPDESRLYLPCAAVDAQFLA